MTAARTPSSNEFRFSFANLILNSSSSKWMVLLKKIDREKDMSSKIEYTRALAEGLMLIIVKGSEFH